MTVPLESGNEKDDSGLLESGTNEDDNGNSGLRAVLKKTTKCGGTGLVQTSSTVLKSRPTTLQKIEEVPRKARS